MRREKICINTTEVLTAASGALKHVPDKCWKYSCVVFFFQPSIGKLCSGCWWWVSQCSGSTVLGPGAWTGLSWIESSHANLVLQLLLSWKVRLSPGSWLVLCNTVGCCFGRALVGLCEQHSVAFQMWTCVLCSVSNGNSVNIYCRTVEKCGCWTKCILLCISPNSLTCSSADDYKGNADLVSDGEEQTLCW